MKFLLWIATFGCFLLSWWWYVCPHKRVCPFGTYSSATQIFEIPDTGSSTMMPGMEEGERKDFVPIVFAWSDDQPVTTPKWPSHRDSIVSLLGESDLLEITGFFYLDEENSTAAENLGWARANQVRNLFDSLDSDRIRLKSRSIDDSQDISSPFDAIDFRRVIYNEAVKEIEGRMVIHFPFASVQMLNSHQLHEYLDELVERLKNTDERVLLVGHTDNSASSDLNFTLGQRRADAIRDLLVNKGLSSDRITTESKGETDPIATNATEEGRRLNRRVELTIIS